MSKRFQFWTTAVLAFVFTFGIAIAGCTSVQLPKPRVVGDDDTGTPNVCEDTFYSLVGIALMSPVESYAIKNADKIREIEVELMEHSKTCPRCSHYIRTGEVDESLKIVKRETSIFDGLEADE